MNELLLAETFCHFAAYFLVAVTVLGVALQLVIDR